VPLFRPVTTHDVDADAQVRPPGEAVAVKPVTGDPPLEAGADHDTVTWLLPATTELIPGAPGTVEGVAGVTDSEDAEAAPVPTEFVAVTANV